MYWRLHAAIFGGEPEAGRAADFLRARGDKVQLVLGRHTNLPPVAEMGHKQEPYLAITTLQDARLTKKPADAIPWLYWDISRYDVSYWLPRLSNNIPVLNRSGAFWPLGMLQNCGINRNALHLTSGQAVFVKPDKGHKPFTGFIATVGSSGGLELSSEYQLKGISPELMCFVAPQADVDKTEWRFWVVNRKVVACTPYAWESDVEWSPAPDNVRRVAELMAVNEWQPDIAYVVDVATVNGEAFLLEINAASTSGMYNVDATSVLTALRESAHLEYAGELTLES